MKFWNLKTNNDSAESARLDLFGTIGADGFWEQGFDDTSFKAEMQSIPSDKALDIFINSNGGSVFSALAIYNMIKRHKGAVTITVAGMAASAATIITSVPNARVIMPSGSMMMVHAPSAYAGQANAAQLRSLADTLDKIGGSIVDIYKQKTDQSEETLVEMMSTDTYLTASEAVELGFADEIDNSFQIAAVRSNGQITVNGLTLSEDRLKHIPAAWTGEDKKGEKSMTYEEFKAQHPEFYNQAKEEGKQEGIAEGGQNERERIKAIEEMALVGHEALVMAAKYDKPVSPEAFAMAMIKAEKEQKQAFLDKRKKDADPLNGVDPSMNQGIDPKAEQKAKEQAELEKVIAAGKAAFEARNKK